MNQYLFVFLFFLMGCSTNQSTTDFLTDHGYIVVPLKKNAVGHYEFKAEINGIQGNFILDTGASGTVIERKKIKKFKISKLGEPIQAGGLGTTKNKANSVEIEKIKIGSFSLRGLKIVATDLSHINKVLTKHGVQPQDGVIGADILKRTQAIIDYGSSKLYLKKI